MIKLFVATPSTGTVSDEHAFALREIAERYEHQVKLVYPDTCVRRKFHDFARNEMVREFLLSDADILWFLDSDVVPPKHVLDLVVTHGDKWQVAGAPYPVFMSPSPDQLPQVCFTVYEETSKGGVGHKLTVPKEGREFVTGLATGCLFIKRAVFMKLVPPFFEFKFDASNRGLKEGEDLGFVRKMKEMGVQFFTDYSMVCKHTKEVDLLDVNNYAIQFANNTLAAYTESLKAEISSVVATAYKKGRDSALPKFGESAGLAVPHPKIIC